VEAIRETFLQFVNKVPFYGAAILCLDQPHIQLMIPRVEKRLITYGLESGADFTARRVVLEGLTSRFEVAHRGSPLGECQLRVPGIHNVLNALAAIAVGVDLELPFATVARALGGFSGVQRRFQCFSRTATPARITCARSS
jgi:UDP-N-acetylmuramate--alanine ligase